MTDDEIRLGLKKLCAGPLQTLLCEVKEIDLDKPCLTVETIAESIMYKVRFKTGIDGIIDGWVEVPEVGSWVLVGIIQNDPNTAFLIKTSKVTKVQLTVGKTLASADAAKFTLESPMIEFNKGTLGGLPIAKNIVIKLNLIEADLMVLKGLLATLAATPPAIPILGAQVNPFAAYSAIAIVGSTELEISNPKITQ